MKAGSYGVSVMPVVGYTRYAHVRHVFDWISRDLSASALARLARGSSTKQIACKVPLTTPKHLTPVLASMIQLLGFSLLSIPVIEGEEKDDFRWDKQKKNQSRWADRVVRRETRRFG